ncbi:MgtC/SapB family protein [Patescibacteria group bacterium]
MLQLSIPVKLILSLVLGAVIGLERESYEKEIKQPGQHITGGLGVRTFALITTLGTIAGFLRTEYFSLFLTINITFMALVLAYYVLGSIFYKDNGITTEIAIILSYFIGVFIALEFFPIQLVLAITVIMILILSRKEKIKTITAGIKRNEINAFISYAIIALVVLPFLPNKSFSLSDIPGLQTILSSYQINLGKLALMEIINPFKLWLIVALITGVEMAGYALEKTIGQKGGLLLTSMAGGFVSSTATTQSLAQQSKKTTAVNSLVAAAVFSNLASFFQIFILIASINSLFLVQSTVFFASIIISALVTGLIFFKIKERSNKDNLQSTKKVLEQDKIFSLTPALKFALIFLVIRVFSKISLYIFGNNGFMATSALASLTGLDAVTINISEMAGQTIVFKTAVLTLILVNAVNLLSKIVYSFFQGKKEFAYKFSLAMGIIILSSFVGLLGV